MEELAREYERKHEGHVTKITSYSFEFETVPNKDIENELFRRCQFADDPDHDIFQWLLYVASRQIWKNTAREIVEIALAEWY